MSTFFSLGTEMALEYPIISNPIPSDFSVNVPLSITNLTFTITDIEGDLLNFSVMTSPYIGSDNMTEVGNGTYNITIENLSLNTIYKWYVNVTDGTYWTNKSYTFTTIDFKPSFSVLKLIILLSRV